MPLDVAPGREEPTIGADRHRVDVPPDPLQRQDLPPAVALLAQAIDKEPPAELNDRLRLRLGDCLALQGNWQGALGQFQALALAGLTATTLLPVSDGVVVSVAVTV